MKVIISSRFLRSFIKVILFLSLMLFLTPPVLAQDNTFDPCVPCDWYSLQKRIFKSAKTPYPDDYSRCFPVKVKTNHRIIYRSVLGCQNEVEFVFQYRAEVWGEVIHYKNLDEFSIQFPPPTHVACEMTKSQNLYVEKYEIVEVACTVKEFTECGVLSNKRMYGLSQVHETSSIDKFPIYYFEINSLPDTKLGKEGGNIFFRPHFIEFMPPGHENHLAIMSTFQDLDITNSGHFTMDRQALEDGLVVGYYETLVKWTESDTFQGGEGAYKSENLLNFRIEFVDLPDLYDSSNK